MTFQIKDSGQRTEFSTGAVRDMGEGKGRYDLIPPYPLKRLAVHFEKGAIKYGERNWEKGIKLGSYLDSCLRHLNEYRAGKRDEDHLIAAVWNLFCMIDTEQSITDGRLPQTLDDNSYIQELRHGSQTADVDCRGDGFRREVDGALTILPW